MMRMMIIKIIIISEVKFPSLQMLMIGAFRRNDI